MRVKIERTNPSVWRSGRPKSTLSASAASMAIEDSFAQRFPKKNARGRPPVSPRVLLALELLKHAA